MRIVFLGDSLTEGVDGTPYLRLLSERARLDPRLSAAELINAGVGGDTVVNLARRGAQDVVLHDPDWVVVQVGVNDCATWLLRRSLPTLRTIRGRRYFSRVKQVPGAVTPQRYRDGLRVLIADLRATTRARIALCTPSLYGESPQDRSWRLLERYVEVVMQVAAERGCPIIDVHSALISGLAGPPPRLSLASRLRRGQVIPPGADYDAAACARGYRLTYDGLHFTTRGASLFADAIYPWLIEVAAQGTGDADGD